MTERNSRGRLIALVIAGVIGLAAIAGGVFLLSGGGGEPTPVAQQPAPTRDAPETSQPTTPTGPPPVQPVFKPQGQPPGTVRLPSGGTAKLVREEVDPSGSLPIPHDLHEATWWGAGLEAPKGATVLAGHVNWKGETGPFDELWGAEQGQPVTVLDSDGTTYRYQISDIHTLDKEELPAQAPALFGQAGEHRLVLVTCGGRFVGGDEGYEQNRIVVATPVD